MDQIITLIGNYGYVAIFALLLLGIFGAPVPDETLLIFSGFLVSRGDLRLPLTIPSAALGSMCGITISYLLGRFGGFYLLKKYGARIHITEDRLQKAKRWFDRGGKWSLLFGYYIPGVRHLTAIIAGSTRMNYPAFSLFAYGGALIWASTFIMAGFIFGEKWRIIANGIQRHLLAASLIALAVIVMSYFFVYFRKTKPES